ncbi:MAG: flagellar biosynthetic protein FliR [Spirochaetae bacterium HGW-Spirochaetae-1]|jgi:flagellar biosynthetic protein FliR|nr:MAG: flagellar biosynthetic protein FliR [Spirochaetae bacterium HGW-Spirochaetae-1]
MEYFVYHFQVFLLIMMRMSAMIVIAPFYSSAVIPMRLKALLSFLIALVIFPIIASHGYKITGNMGIYYLMVLREVVIGLYIGFLVSVMFASFQLAGQLFSVQMGFGINEVLDPLGQVSVPLIGQLQNLIGLLIFLAIGGHHFLIEALYRSYELAPLVSADKAVMGQLFKYLMYTFSGMFIVAIKIALPIVGVLFLISVSMGVLAKAAPQMNIMMMGFPFSIVVAFGLLIITAPLVVRIMQVSLERTFTFVVKVLHHWPG